MSRADHVKQGLEYIRRTYSVPAHLGVKVTAYGKPGVVTGVSGPHIMIRYDGQKHSLPHHPTDEIVYEGTQP